MGRFMDLVEANRQRAHEERQVRNRRRIGWAIIGAGLLGAKLWSDHRQTEINITEETINV